MRRLARILLIAVVAVAATGAAEAEKLDSPALDKQLDTFDPKAVAAARHYYSQPALKAAVLAMGENASKAMLGVVARQNPRLTPEQQQKVQRVVRDAMAERLDLMLKMSMVSALQTLSTDEIVALDKFYSSPVGAGIMAKMPRLSAKLPAMMQAIMPDYLAEIRERMKKEDGEVKL